MGSKLKLAKIQNVIKSYQLVSELRNLISEAGELRKFRETVNHYQTPKL
jgi:hypothetical protein